MAYFPLNKNHIKPSHMGGSGASKPTIMPAAPALKEGIATTSKKKLSECRVLVVDDNSDNALLLSLYLKGKVKVIDISETGADAIEKIKQAKYDIVLSDMRLDGVMTGLEVEKEAKKLSPATLFVFVTGLDRDSFAKMFSGQDSSKLVIQKPIKKDELLGFLGKLCDS